MTPQIANQSEPKTELTQRLQRLQAFLNDDPQNDRLRADLFETALSAAEFVMAEEYLQQALEMQPDSAEWRFRLASLRIAQKRFEEAQDELLRLEAAGGAHPSITHNLAHIKFTQKNYAACRELLMRWVDVTEGQAPTTMTVPSEMQVLWLRTLHRLGLLDEAWIWVSQQKDGGTLSDAAAGVASLIAIDANHLQEALQLSELGLSKEPDQMEALVARASVALGQRDPDTARRLVQRALRSNSTDGRAWSALGFAEMLAMNIPHAKQNLEQAVHWMPTHIGTWHGLGWACLLVNDMDGARKAFDTALNLDRNFAESHGGLAVILARINEPALAQEHIQIALRLDKMNLSARYAQAVLSGESKNAESIQLLAQRLLGDRSAPLGGSVIDWMRRS